MSRDAMTNFLSLNRSLKNVGGGVRQFRLPRMNPFPKLESSIARSNNGSERRFAACPVTRDAFILDGDRGAFPEIETDVINPSASYAVENIKRQRTGTSVWSRVGLSHLVGRLFSSHRAARP
jgi:hypothetical protein